MTAPLTPERLAEVRAHVDTRTLTRDDAADLLAALDAATERAEKAEAALARVEEAGIPVGREVLEDAIDHVDYFITERLGNERSVQGAKVLKSQLREVLEGKP